MIEAQALYINTLIKKVVRARQKGGSVRIEPKPHVVQKYNEEVQSRLAQSAFADTNCNSWYKNEAGLITNNWSDAVIPYQKRTSFIDWNEFNIEGAGADEIQREGRTQWARVIEETQVSNVMILVGLIAATSAVTVLSFCRRPFKSILR
jgi:hypothetical protein